MIKLDENFICNGPIVPPLNPNYGQEPFDHVWTDLGLCCGKESVFETYNWDQALDSLPLTILDETNNLRVEFINMTSNVDLTGFLPTNVSIGDKILVRKLDDSIFKIIFTDGAITYDFVNRKGEFICFEWDGIKYNVI